MDELSDASDDDDPIRTPIEILGAMELQLRDLLIAGIGRPPSTDVAMVKRRVTRKSPPGYASKVAEFFEAVLLAVNETHSLQLYPLTLVHALECMGAGRKI